ncbi:hypothetical protein ACFL5O_11755, partial [Myxococcota bacterium]
LTRERVRQLEVKALSRLGALEDMTELRELCGVGSTCTSVHTRRSHGSDESEGDDESGWEWAHTAEIDLGDSDGGEWQADRTGAAAWVCAKSRETESGLVWTARVGPLRLDGRTRWPSLMSPCAQVAAYVFLGEYAVNDPAGQGVGQGELCWHDE